MSGEQKFEIGLTDKELLEIHLGVRDNLPSKPLAGLRNKLAGILPPLIKYQIIPDDKDPLTALPMAGRKLAKTVITISGDPVYKETERDSIELMAYCFAARLENLARQELKINPARVITEKQKPDKLEAYGHILAVVFASDNFTPALGRHTLETMAPKIDELVHPGRRELREAMEAVISKYETE